MELPGDRCSPGSTLRAAHRPCRTNCELQRQKVSALPHKQLWFQGAAGVLHWISVPKPMGLNCVPEPMGLNRVPELMCRGLYPCFYPALPVPSSSHVLHCALLCGCWHVFWRLRGEVSVLVEDMSQTTAQGILLLTCRHFMQQVSFFLCLSPPTGANKWNGKQNLFLFPKSSQIYFVLGQILPGVE